MHCGTEYVISVRLRDATLFKSEIKRRGQLPSLSSTEDKKRWRVKNLILSEFLGGYRVDTVIFKDGTMWIRNETLHNIKNKKVMQLEVSGITKEGKHFVIVTHDPSGPGYGTFSVRVDGEERPVSRVDRLRDGGTTFIRLVNGGTITFPNRIGDKNKTPTYNGLEII